MSIRNDNQIHIRLVVAPVMQDPNHTTTQQPYVFIQVIDLTQAGKVLFTQFLLPNSDNAAWQRINPGTSNEIDFTDWKLIDVNGATAGMSMGDQVQITVLA